MPTRQVRTFPLIKLEVFCLLLALVSSGFRASAASAVARSPESRPVYSSPEDLLQDFQNIPEPSSPGIDRVRRARAAAAFAEGQRLTEAERFPEALARYREAAEADSSYTPTTAQIALTLLRLDRKAEAVELLNKQLVLQPDAASLHSLLAYCLLDPTRPQNTPKAVDHARKALELDPTLISNYRILADGLNVEQNPVRLNELLLQARQTESTEAAFHLRMADIWTRILLETNTRPSSISLQVLPFYEKAYRADPFNPMIAFQLGQVHFDSGNYQDALRYYQASYDRNPRINGLRERLALSYMSCNREGEAISVLENLLEDFPDRKNLYATIGELYERAGKWPEAAKYYLLYTQITAPNAEDYIRLAQAQMMIKKPEAALLTMETAEQDFPGLDNILLLKSITLRSLKRYPEAIAILERVEKTSLGNKNTVNASFYFQYGATLDEAQKRDEAEKMLKKCVALDSRHHQAMNHLGYMWAEQKRNLKEAEQLLIKALTLSPENSAYFDSLGWIYYQQGDYAKAKSWLLKARGKAPEDSDILEHLGLTHYQLGEIEEAVTAWQLIPQDAPNFTRLEALIRQAKGLLAEGKKEP